MTTAFEQSYFDGETDIFGNTIPVSPTSAVSRGIADSHNKSEQAARLLTDQLEYLKNELANITNLPPITGATLPDNPVHQVEAFQLLGTIPVRPTDIDFSKPPLPVITPVIANFPTQAQYSSALLTDVKSVLEGLINNWRSSGLNPVIEQELWDRGRERTTATMLGKIAGIKRNFARSGWAMPQGDESEQIFQAQEEAAEADVTESRSIAVAQADLEQKNLQFSIQQAANLEGVLGNMYTAIQGMMVEAEKSRVSTLNDINKINVEVFKELVSADVAFAQGKLGMYDTDAKVFGELVQAESAKISAQVQVQGAEINYNVKKGEFSIEVAKANIATMLAQKELSIGTLKAIATLLSQLVAAYGSAVHYSAGISQSSSFGTSYSQSRSSSYPHKESSTTE